MHRFWRTRWTVLRGEEILSEGVGRDRGTTLDTDTGEHTDAAKETQTEVHLAPPGGPPAGTATGNPAAREPSYPAAGATSTGPPAGNNNSGEPPHEDKEGEDKLEFREQLVNQDMQYWVLGGLVALPMLLWAQSRPMSCTVLSEEAAAFPGRCGGIVGDAAQLRLPDFCLRTCMSSRTQTFVCSLVLAMVAQATIVLMNEEGCKRWMQISLFFTAHSHMEQVEQQVESQTSEGVKIPWIIPGKRFLNKWLWRNGRDLVHQVQEKSKVSFGQSMLLHPKMLARFSQFCLLISISQILFLFLINVSTFTTYFECATGKNSSGFAERLELELNYEIALVHLIGHAMAFFILFIALWLQMQAMWTKQVVLQEVVDLEKLKSQFTDETHTYLKRESELDDSYKQELKQAFLNKLIKVEHDGYTEDPKGAFQRGSWGGQVTLHFAGRKSLANYFPDNPHKVLAICFLLLGAGALLSASQLCWSCVHRIRVLEHSTVGRLEELLHLLGACGRHKPTGMGSLIASIMLVGSSILQFVVVRLSDPSYNGGRVVRVLQRQARSRQQLWMKMFHSSDHYDLDAEFYKEANLDVHLKEFWCYTWVKGTNEGAGEEEIPTCDSGLQDNDRGWWRRSASPMKVHLAHAPEDSNVLAACTEGLVREEFGLPVLCVDIPREQDRKKQFVPLQFVADGFHVWLNLGSKHTWEELSIGLAFGAILSTLGDLVFFYAYAPGILLETCDDVLNQPCALAHAVSVEQGVEERSIEFRRSLVGGPLAIFGAACALLACLCLHVALEREAGEVSSVTGAYFSALLRSLDKALCIVPKFVIESSRRCATALYKKHCQ